MAKESVPTNIKIVSYLHILTAMFFLILLINSFFFLLDNLKILSNMTKNGAYATGIGGAFVLGGFFMVALSILSILFLLVIIILNVYVSIRLIKGLGKPLKISNGITATILIIAIISYLIPSLYDNRYYMLFLVILIILFVLLFIGNIYLRKDRKVIEYLKIDLNKNKEK